MTTQHASYADYLRALADSAVKLEYCDGVIYAMAGGTVAHAALGANVVRLLGTALLGSCTAYSSDLRVRIESSDLSTFPDAAVICGAPIVSSIDAHAVTNPTLLVEVTSPSTEDSDRGDKLSHYKQLSSLSAVLFISHRERRVTLVQRTPKGWDEQEFRSGEVVVVRTPAVRIAVDDLYVGVSIDAA